MQKCVSGQEQLCCRDDKDKSCGLPLLRHLMLLTTSCFEKVTHLSSLFLNYNWEATTFTWLPHEHWMSWCQLNSACSCGLVAADIGSWLLLLCSCGISLDKCLQVKRRFHFGRIMCLYWFWDAHFYIYKQAKVKQNEWKMKTQGHTSMTINGKNHQKNQCLHFCASVKNQDNK